MKNFIVYKFSPEDLCVSKGGKILLLDKHVNWSRQFGLVPGEEYVLEDLSIRELEKCRIITGGTFINVGYFPAEIDVWGGPYIYNDKIGFNASRVIKYKEIQVSSEKIEGLEFSALGDLSEEKKELLGLLPSKTQETIISFLAYIQWVKKEGLTILEVGKDFERKVGYKLISFEDFINPQTVSHNYSVEPKLQKIRKSLFEEIFIDGRIGEIKEKKESLLEYIKLSESGLTFSFVPISVCPTGQMGKLKIGDYEHPSLVCYPGDGTGSYLEFAMSRLDNPPVLLKNEDMEWLNMGGRLAFSDYSHEYSYGGWDGTDTIWDCFPKGYLRQEETPKETKGWVSLYNTYRKNSYLYDPNFSYEEYIGKVEEARIRTLAFKNLEANGKYSPYSQAEIIGTYFLVEEVNLETDFLYDYGWTCGYLSQSSYNRDRGILVQSGIPNGFDIRKSLEEIVNKFKFIIPIDGSGIYLRIPKEADLHGKVRFAGLIKKIRGKLNELYPSARWRSGWDSNILDSQIKDVEKSNFDENDIDTFEEKVLNLYQIQKSLSSAVAKEATPVVRQDEKESYDKNLSTSNDAMAEALRKAGLVK